MVLPTLESINAAFIHPALAAPERLTPLNATAIPPMHSLMGMETAKRLAGLNSLKKIEP